jgi:hypothetical protein
MRIASLAVALLALATLVPAFAEAIPTGSSRAASLRCVQYAMVREHHHNPNGWPTDCAQELWPQSKKG